jgi:hypothetical protein
MTIPYQSPDNASTAAGTLQPTPQAIAGQVQAGEDLENFLQQWIASVAGIDEVWVRPRWQPQPPNLPDFGQDWVSVGITESTPLNIYAAAIWYPAYGIQQFQRHVEFTLLCSFYGPNCAFYSGNLHIGAQVEQNHWILKTKGVKLIDTGGGRRVPELIKEQWWDRIDIEVTFRRIIRRNYQIRPIASAAACVTIDDSR